MRPSVDIGCRPWALRRAAGGIAALAMLAGCTSPASQLRQCQQEKEQLLAAIRQQRQTAMALREQVASLEQRLDQAEKELARSGSATRFSSRPIDQPPAAKAPPAGESTLPWKPAGKLPAPEQTPSQEPKSIRPAASITSTVVEPAQASGRIPAGLRQLVARDPRCEYDPHLGAVRVRLPLAFREDGTTLTAESKQHLDQLTQWLKRPELREVRVLVAGYGEGRSSSDENPRPATARERGLAQATAVADYLDRHGIAHERLGVTAVGSRGPWGQAGSPSPIAGEVQIYLLPPDAPLVGWGPTGHALRR